MQAQGRKELIVAAFGDFLPQVSCPQGLDSSFLSAFPSSALAFLLWSKKGVKRERATSSPLRKSTFHQPGSHRAITCWEMK